nr:MAG TPA: hypothetical protein [Caudoviricetes sp.]
MHCIYDTWTLSIFEERLNINLVMQITCKPSLNNK